MDKQKKFMFLKLILTVTPAFLLGIMAMIYHNISKLIWLQNLFLMLFCGCLSFIFIFRHVQLKASIIAGISMVLLLLTLFSNSIDGVHRWINLMGLNINAAMAVLPVLLAAIYYLIQKKRTVTVSTIIICTAVILYIQPDASQLSGFSLPVILFLLDQNRTKVRYLISAVLIILSALSWIFLDGLEPVSYVEGIVGLLYQISFVWALVGVPALLLIPLPFILNPPKSERCLFTGIGIYYIVICSLLFPEIFLFQLWDMGYLQSLGIGS